MGYLWSYRALRSNPGPFIRRQAFALPVNCGGPLQAAHFTLKGRIAGNYREFRRKPIDKAGNNQYTYKVRILAHHLSCQTF